MKGGGEWGGTDRSGRCSPLVRMLWTRSRYWYSSWREGEGGGREGRMEVWSGGASVVGLVSAIVAMGVVFSGGDSMVVGSVSAIVATGKVLRDIVGDDV